jgi:hypothetical protein
LSILKHMFYVLKHLFFNNEWLQRKERKIILNQYKLQLYLNKMNQNEINPKSSSTGYRSTLVEICRLVSGAKYTEVCALPSHYIL